MGEGTFSFIVINRNMGCIEMQMAQLEREYEQRLIETWDVLKWHLTALLDGIMSD